MKNNIRYEKSQREKAVREKKWLITIAVNGKHVGDDSITVQGVSNMPFAKRVAALGVEFLKGAGKS